MFYVFNGENYLKSTPNRKDSDLYKAENNIVRIGEWNKHRAYHKKNEIKTIVGRI
jgi:hypothetical protein